MHQRRIPGGPFGQRTWRDITTGGSCAPAAEARVDDRSPWRRCTSGAPPGGSPGQGGGLLTPGGCGGQRWSHRAGHTTRKRLHHAPGFAGAPAATAGLEGGYRTGSRFTPRLVRSRSARQSAQRSPWVGAPHSAQGASTTRPPGTTTVRGQNPDHATYLAQVGDRCGHAVRVSSAVRSRRQRSSSSPRSRCGCSSPSRYTCLRHVSHSPDRSRSVSVL